MKTTKTNIKDVLLVHRDVFTDDRGTFMESFRDTDFPVKFVQDNVSMSARGVIRGLHYQIQQPQDKLVSVLKGSIIDVAVDIRKDSPTFGKYVKVLLREKRGSQLFIPVGFAHGFLALEDHTVVSYKCSDYYSKEGSRGIRYDDPDLGIDWFGDLETEFRRIILSVVDESHPQLKDAETF